MTVSDIFNLIASFGTVIAGIALWLTYLQFRKLDASIKGNTYQLLSDQAIQMLGLLLEHPRLRYLDLSEHSVFKSRREQEVFDRLLANYLDNVWWQMKLGLMNKELEKAYKSLIESIVVANPELAKKMATPNFTESLRKYIEEVLSRNT